MTTLTTSCLRHLEGSLRTATRATSVTGLTRPVVTSARPRGLRLSQRGHRVLVLLGTIIVLSMIDLALTLHHLRNGGLLEDNPVIVLLIQWTQSPWVLVIHKLATLAICGGVLYRLRDRRSAEIAAWLVLGILTWVMYLWWGYCGLCSDPAVWDYLQEAQRSDFVSL